MVTFQIELISYWNVKTCKQRNTNEKVIINNMKKIQLIEVERIMTR